MKDGERGAKRTPARWPVRRGNARQPHKLERQSPQPANIATHLACFRGRAVSDRSAPRRNCSTVRHEEGCVTVRSSLAPPGTNGPAPASARQCDRGSRSRPNSGGGAPLAPRTARTSGSVPVHSHFPRSSDSGQYSSPPTPTHTMFGVYLTLPRLTPSQRICELVRFQLSGWLLSCCTRRDG